MKELYEKYQKFLPALFFVGGFLVDLLTTDRIDQSFSLIQQLIYLIILMFFVYWEVVTPEKFKNANHWLHKLWGFHIEILHFLFGSLLSLYTIFYFKSASLVTSFIFMIFLTGLLVMNEIPRFQKMGFVIRFSMLALCLVSYFIYLVPVVTGSIGWGAFLLALVLSSALYAFLVMKIFRKFEDKERFHKRMVLPGVLIHLSFLLLYAFKVLPPVPISLKYIGIYHNIHKENGHFHLSYERSWWRFWQSGAQTFVKRQGDKVFCFVSIFSPAQFKEKMNLIWYQKKKGEWTARDTISLPISGGRDQGYRGYAYKSNFESGSWQVRVVTSDDREVGRISFDVSDEVSDEPREWKRDLF